MQHIPVQSQSHLFGCGEWSGWSNISYLQGVPSGAEIIPVEPDPGHAGEGIVNGRRLRGAFFMNITINGTLQDLGDAGTLGQLLKCLDINPERVAVMVNDRIIPRAERDGSVLKEGDRVEILTFMGGG